MANILARGAWAAALLVASLAGAAAPAAAQSRPAPTAAAPVVAGLEVNADAGLTPGSTLAFTLRGTPNGIARIQVAGTNIAVPLRESGAGVYTGQYTVKRREPGLQPTSLIRAQLTASGRTATSTFSFPADFAPAQAAAAPATAPVAVPAGTPRIERFSSIPVDRLDPGTELKFVLEGTPGARASVQVPGLMLTIPMLEQRPGQYIGSYTLRRSDTVASGPVVATLRAGERLATAELANPLAAAASASSPAPTASMGGTPTAALPLQLTSPAPNAAVDAAGVVLAGRTAPGAAVHVRVDAIPPALPGRAAVAHSVGEQTVNADPNGFFTVSFGPQRFAPGTRYEVGVTARQGQQSTPQQRLVLFQRS